MNTLPRVKALLMEGFTTIRNVGDPSLTTYALRDAIHQGIVPRPRMFVAEAQISVDGGDYDASNWDVIAMKVNPLLHIDAVGEPERG